MNLDKKIKVLEKIGKELNKKNIVWALGGSTLLYFNNIVTEFNDLDILIHEDYIQEALEILNKYGDSNRIKCFYEYVIDGVDVDIISGYRIVKDDVEYDCSLKKESIQKFIEINGTSIPLDLLENWRRYYYLMGRDKKVELIDKVIKKI